jgi:hypothetical protein
MLLLKITHNFFINKMILFSFGYLKKREREEKGDEEKGEKEEKEEGEKYI